MASRHSDAGEERVALGLSAALLAVLGGVVLTVAIYRAGFIAGVASLATAFGASYLYARAAGSRPRRGLVPLILLIVLGVVVSFFATVASDLVDQHQAISAAAGVDSSTLSYVADNLFETDVLSGYGRDILFFAAFAGLGVFGTVRRLLDDR